MTRQACHLKVEDLNDKRRCTQKSGINIIEVMPPFLKYFFTQVLFIYGGLRAEVS